MLYDDEHKLFFTGEGNAEELFRALHAGALRVDNGAAACVFAARCGHNLLGIALVCDDDQKLVFGIFQDAFLSFLKRLTVR